MNFFHSSKAARSIGALLSAFQRKTSEHPVPPVEATTGIGRLLWTAAPPLIDPRHRVIVVFSEKAACTNVLIWFFTQVGHVKAARDFHHWPHEYRRKVYYYSQSYRDALRSDLTEFKVIRVVRDPYDRAASSFRHAVRFGLMDDDINRSVGRRSTTREGLSFSEFLSVLEQTDLRSCNPHFSVQRHPMEDTFKVDHLINVSKESLSKRFNQIESELGLARTDLDNDPWVKRLRKHNRPARELEGTALYTRRLTRDEARNGPWPRHADLLTPEARMRIAKLYSRDIESYC
jgi:hypothetical protein